MIPGHRVVLLGGGTDLDDPLMQVPKVLLGQCGEVKKRVAPLVKAYIGGKRANELDFGELVSSAEEPSALFPFNPGPGSTRADFHCYPFLYGLREAQAAGKLDRGRFEEAFGWSLEQPGPSWAP
jgi:hypothetical protein